MVNGVPGGKHNLRLGFAAFPVKLAGQADWPIRQLRIRQDAMTEYRVELPVFHGPLDLLLYLVKRNEVEIADIPIATITDQYLQYLGMLQRIDVEAAGEFLVMASTLMEIKSRLLLPRQDECEGCADDDPRGELVKQLMEYKKYREAADRLEELAERQAQRRPRQLLETPDLPTDPAARPLQRVELWDLVSAFDRLVRATLTAEQNAIVMDDTPQQVHMETILERLAAAGRLEFAALFQPLASRGRCVGLFLALLELIKEGRINVEQAAPFAPIIIVPPPAPAGPSLTLAVEQA
jgi:segregation and condensation protein A